MPSLSPFGVINNKVSDKHLCTAFLDHIFSVPSGNTLCVCVFSFFLSFFSRNVCDNNEDSVHRLSQAVSFDFKVM